MGFGPHFGRFFSQTHPVTLLVFMYVSKKRSLFDSKIIMKENQGCQIFLGPNISKREKYTK
jgi:hypothetical protein